MSNVIGIKGAVEAPRSQRSSMETLIVSLDEVLRWRVPPFQRPIRINAKIQKLAEDIKRDGISIPGIITLGRLGRAGDLYIVDGQHRCEGFKMSGLQEVIADVRIVHFDTMAEMADEFVQLNSALVRMRPDDILRGMEPMSRPMQRIRAECAYVGYDNIRRGTESPMVGMSMLLRWWEGSANETPVSSPSNRTAPMIGMELDELSTSNLIRFLHLAFAAWGREPEYYRLWGGLNMVLCMWLYRRIVLDKQSSLKRHVMLSDAQFRQCLMSLSADNSYIEWLQGRIMGERDRSPGYGHIRRIFANRLQAEGMAKPLMPGPAWSSRTGGSASRMR